MHVIEPVAFISEVMANFVTDASTLMVMRYPPMTAQFSKKRKNYRRIVVGSEHWQWIYGKRSVVASCEEDDCNYCERPEHHRLGDDEQDDAEPFVGRPLGLQGNLSMGGRPAAERAGGSAHNLTLLLPGVGGMRA